PIVHAFRTLIPEKNIVVEVSHQNRVLRLIEEGGLLTDAFLRQFALGDVIANCNVLVGLTVGMNKRNYRGVDPIVTSVLRAILYFAAPNLSAGNCRPKISDEFLGMIGGIDDAVVLAQKLLS